MFASILGGVKNFCAAILPFSKNVALSPAVRWLIWIVLDVSFLAVLYFVNAWVGLLDALPELWRGARAWYLPILGQLFIFMGIVLYWFYVLWFASPDDSPFPDIDAAWNEAMKALEQAGIRLTNVPLFLVVGRPGTSEANLFEAAGSKLVVKQTPTNPGSPLHAFAERDAVYVTCRGASVVGKLASILVREDSPKLAGPTGLESSGGYSATEIPWKREDMLFKEKVSATEGREATTLEKRVLYRLSLAKPLGGELLANTNEIARLKARLGHLCRLIARDRQPHCAANGILLLIPLGGTDTPGEAQLTAQACQEDLQTVRNEMKIDCPLVTLMVDMEDLPGFPDFIRSQSEKHLRLRRGIGFPMSTRLPREEALEQVGISLRWACTTYFQDSIYKAFQSETVANNETNPFFPANTRLALLLAEMNERADSVSTIVQHAIAPENRPLFRYTGFYWSATGPKGSQGFVADVLQKLVKDQSSVTWTEAALAEDAQNYRWANTYFISACVLFVLWCLLLAGAIALVLRSG